MLKVYEQLNTQPFAVKWGASGQEAFLQAGPLLSYENVDMWVMDLVTLRRTRPAPPRGHSTTHSEECSIEPVAVLRQRIAASESKSE